MRLIPVIAISLAVLGGAVAASGKPGLAQEDDINAGLFVVAVADKIRRECSGISARFLAARNYVTQLKKMAVDRGYSEDEIERYINDKDGKAEMREIRNEYFESKGASNLDPESLCVLGHAEIESESRIGALLRKW